MYTKNQRLELRVTNSFLDRVDEWRRNQIDLPSKSDAIRQLAEDSLNRESKKDWQPSKEQKLILSLTAQVLVNQCKLDDTLEPGLKNAEILLKAVTSGHYWAIDSDLWSYLPEECIPSHIASEAAEIMQMWMFIEDSYEQLSNTDKSLLEERVPNLGKNPKFKGFDEKREWDYFCVARMLVDDMNRFPKFKGRELKSLFERLGIYRRMLESYKSICKNLMMRYLNVNELETLLKIADN